MSPECPDTTGAAMAGDCVVMQSRTNGIIIAFMVPPSPDIVL
jgi:hypothetical protein